MKTYETLEDIVYALYVEKKKLTHSELRGNEYIKADGKYINLYSNDNFEVEMDASDLTCFIWNEWPLPRPRKKVKKWIGSIIFTHDYAVRVFNKFAFHNKTECEEWITNATKESDPQIHEIEIEE